MMVSFAASVSFRLCLKHDSHYFVLNGFSALFFYLRLVCNVSVFLPLFPYKWLFVLVSEEESVYGRFLLSFAF